MIFSATHGLCILSPPKTGTKYRIQRYGHIITNHEFYSWHAFGRVIQKNVENAMDHNYYCFVRNPWSRFISNYNMIHFHKTYKHKKDNFVRAALRYHVTPMHQYYCDEHENVIVDKIMKLENIEQELAYIDKKHNIVPNEIDNVACKYSVDYDSLWTQQAIDRVAEIEAKTIELMGYTFPGEDK